MPNWCRNKVTITLPTEASQTFFALTALAGNQLDFDWYFTAINQARNYRENNLEFLGTKWEFEIYDLEFSGDQVTFFTETAWSPPLYYLDHLKTIFEADYNTPLSFSLVYFEPDTGLLGRYSSANGGEPLDPDYLLDINIAASQAEDNDVEFDVFTAIETSLKEAANVN